VQVDSPHRLIFLPRGTLRQSGNGNYKRTSLGKIPRIPFPSA
jgi:hypothetical protein